MFKKKEIIEDFVVESPRITTLISDDKENLVKEMKKKLFENEEIKFVLERNEKIEVLKSINIEISMSTEMANAMESAFGATILAVNPLLKPLTKKLNVNNVILRLNKESKKFFIKFNYTINESKSLEISSNDANSIIDKYASIICEEKLKPTLYN